MTSSQQRGHEIIHDVRLSDNASGDLCAQRRACVGESRQQREIVVRARRSRASVIGHQEWREAGEERVTRDGTQHAHTG